MDRRILFGFSGAKGSGKDTVADYLCQKHHFVKLAFATPLKEAVAYAFHVDLETLGSGTEKDEIFPFTLITTEIHLSDFLEYLHEHYYHITQLEKDRVIQKYQGTPFNSYREILQIFGTEICRYEIDEHIWCNIIKDRVENCGSHRVILSDVRFKDEKELVGELGGRSVLITRDSIEPSDEHVSENELNGEDYDVLIDNSGSLVGLYFQLDMWTHGFVDRMSKA